MFKVSKGLALNALIRIIEHELFNIRTKFFHLMYVHEKKGIVYKKLLENVFLNFYSVIFLSCLMNTQPAHDVVLTSCASWVREIGLSCSYESVLNIWLLLCLNVFINCSIK